MVLKDVDFYAAGLVGVEGVVAYAQYGGVGRWGGFGGRGRWW